MQEHSYAHQIPPHLRLKVKHPSWPCSCHCVDVCVVYEFVCDDAAIELSSIQGSRWVVCKGPKRWCGYLLMDGHVRKMNAVSVHATAIGMTKGYFTLMLSHEQKASIWLFKQSRNLDMNKT